MANALNFIISEARRRVGYHEGANNWNVFSDIVNKYGLNGCQSQPWCGTFQFALELMAFGKALALKHWNMEQGYVGYSVFETEARFAAAGKTGKTPKKGALVIFKRSHMGRVIALNTKDKTFTCAEGNSGDGCVLKTYGYADAGIKSFCYIDYGDSTLTGAKLRHAVRAAYEMAHYLGWHYGDSHSLPPCVGDGFISCDRLIALALWILGYTAQPAGGITVLNMEAYLTRWGFRKLTTAAAGKADDVVLFAQNGTTTPNAAWHAFFLTAFNGTGNVSKYDCGSQQRIEAAQPFVGVPLSEWPNRYFYCYFRVPEKKEGKRLEISTMVWKAGDSGSHVKLAQILLCGRGYTGKDGKNLKRDGKAGVNTVYALKRFQAKHGLDDTGVCDKRTWNKLAGRKVTEV